MYIVNLIYSQVNYILIGFPVVDLSWMELRFGVMQIHKEYSS